MNASDSVIQFFQYKHLPEHLQAISRQFGEIAENLVKTLPDNPQREQALVKLLEAKDAAVRSGITKAANWPTNETK